MAQARPVCVTGHCRKHLSGAAHFPPRLHPHQFAALKPCRLHSRCPVPLSPQALSTLTLPSCKHPHIRRPCLSPATHPPTHTVPPHLLSPWHLHPWALLHVLAKQREGMVLVWLHTPFCTSISLKTTSAQGLAKGTRSPQADALFLCSVLWAV